MPQRSGVLPTATKTKEILGGAQWLLDVSSFLPVNLDAIRRC